MKCYHLFFSFFIFFMSSIDSFSQNSIVADKEEVHQLIIDLFDGLREGDSE